MYFGHVFVVQDIPTAAGSSVTSLACDSVAMGRSLLLVVGMDQLGYMIEG